MSYRYTITLTDYDFSELHSCADNGNNHAKVLVDCLKNPEVTQVSNDWDGVTTFAIPEYIAWTMNEHIEPFLFDTAYELSSDGYDTLITLWNSII